MPSSTAVRTPLHGALSAFHVAGVRLLFISRRASRRLARASSTAALVSGLSHHSGIRGIRLSVGSTVCAASRIALVNPLAASGAVIFGWPVCSPRLCRTRWAFLFCFPCFFVFFVRKIPFAGIELTSQRVRGLRGTSELPGRPAMFCLGMVSTDLSLLFYAGEIQNSNCRMEKMATYFFLTRG